MSTLERVTTDAELDAAARLPALAFGIDRERSGRWFDEKIGRENLRVTSRDGLPVGCLGRIPMGLYVGGRSVPQVGIAGVAVAPEARGRGVARELMAAAMREMHGEGTPISTLYSALHKLYRGVGYDDAGVLCEAAVPAGMIDTADAGDGWREVRDEDMPGIHACYKAYARKANGMLDRGTYIWDRVRSPGGTPATGFVAEAADGSIEAYCFYTSDKFDARESGTGTSSGNKMTFCDHAWSTPRGLTRLLGFLRGFSSLAGELALLVHPSSPLLAALPDRRIALTVREHWMLRVTNVPAALAARGYPRWMNATIDLSIIDEAVEQNAGEWRLHIKDGRAECERGGNGAIRLGIRALASMYTGHATASLLAGAGRLTADGDGLEIADAAFASGLAPAMQHMF